MWTLTQNDRRLAEQLQARLPERVFDGHAHVYRCADIAPCPGFIAAGPAEAGLDAWRDAVGRFTGASRLAGGLFIPYPSRDGNAAAATEYAVAQAAAADSARALLLVGPRSSRKAIERQLDNPTVAGFKPYHLYAKGRDTFRSDIGEYLPQWVWKLAEARGLLILLHVVKDGALADPDNAATLRRLCETYPRARLVLAHAGRCFHAPNAAAGLPALRGLDNVWFDSSGICEAEPLVAILDEFGPSRLMWGSDFPVSQQRGRCVTLGTGFAWITTDLIDWNDRAFFGEPVLVGLESLRALFQAVDDVGLNAEDIQNIFHCNMVQLLGLRETAAGVTQARYQDARQLIPGGTQLLSKRPEMFAPGQWPAYGREARGCEVWDLDGRRYTDVSIHGIGACLLGFRDPDVTRAVQRRLRLGSFSTLNPPEEVELAELLCQLHPWAEQARFTRAGGEAMQVAVRIARATTDRSVVAVCGYHGWHDWYLAANLGEDDSLRGHLLPGLSPCGVPAELRGTAYTFTYNNREALQRIIDAHGPRLAAVVMEPCRNTDPEPGFLEFVRDVAHRAGALLVFDEITIGWRLTLGGAHLRLGVNPDIAVFAKALGNGHPIGAVIGTRQAMDGANVSFISSTYWTEAIGPAAALATVRKMQQVDVPAHCARVGAKVLDAWRELGRKHGLPVSVPAHFPALAHFAFEHPQAQELKTLYIQEMLDRGFLATTALYATLAHTDEVIRRYIDAIDAVFARLAAALAAGDVAARLRGPAAHAGFRRLL